MDGLRLGGGESGMEGSNSDGEESDGDGAAKTKGI